MPMSTTMPDELAQIIALHKEMFGGYRMQAESEADGEVAQPDAGNQAADPDQEGSTDWKAEARKWEQRAKDNKSAADRLAALEDANKSEAQRQADKLAELEQELNGYKTREQVAGWAKEVAESTGVPAEALRGSTREELEAHASQLKSILGSVPKSVVRNAGKSVTTPEASSERQLARDLFGK